MKLVNKLDDFLEPTIFALDYGEVSDKILKELLKEGLEKAIRCQ